MSQEKKTVSWIKREENLNGEVVCGNKDEKIWNWDERKKINEKN